MSLLDVWASAAEQDVAADAALSFSTVEGALDGDAALLEEAIALHRADAEWGDVSKDVERLAAKMNTEGPAAAPSGRKFKKEDLQLGAWSTRYQGRRRESLREKQEDVS